MRDSFTFYRSFMEALDSVDAETYKRLMMAITHYAMDGIMPDNLSGLEKSIFISWKANVDASNKRKDNGKLGGRPPKEESEKPLVIEEETIGFEDENHRLCDEKPNKKENKKEKENINTIPPKSPQGGARKFVRPSVEEVQEYCNSRNNGIDGSEFVDFYESKGWKIGKESMKDWKAAVRTWERKRGFTPKPKEKPPDRNAGLQKRVPYPEGVAEDSEEMRLFDADMEAHRGDEWVINDDGYWEKRTVRVQQTGCL